MKFKNLIIAIGILIIPFLGKAQTPITLSIQYCDAMYQAMSSGTGCTVSIMDPAGTLVHQEPMYNVGMANSMGFLQKIIFDTTGYSQNGYYKVLFDQACLEGQYDLYFMNNYFYSYPIDMVNDTAYLEVCYQQPFLDTVIVNYTACNGDTSILYNLMNTGCEVSVWNNYNYQQPDSTVISGQYIGFINNEEVFQQEIVYNTHAGVSSYLDFDSDCLASHGYTVMPDSVWFYLEDTINLCFDYNPDTTELYWLDIISNCNSLPSTSSLSNVTGCDFYIKDKDGTTVYQSQISNQSPTSTFHQSAEFDFHAGSAPYTLEFDQICIEGFGYEMLDYVFTLSSTDSVQLIDVCLLDTTITVDSSCVDVWATTSPYIGYYQNYTNYVKFSWGNSTNVPVTVDISILLPPGVSYISSGYGNSIFTDNGSILNGQITLPANSTGSEIIKFFVPSGIADGTLHSYLIEIVPIGINECDYYNNTDKVNFIVGNSYDPNAKTVGLPEEIDMNMQDNFLYTIYFQNTGTAPAQDVYIIDTLSENLDWSTFEFLRSSHQVGIADLGNGVKKFYFNQIWLPDSTTNAEESQGFISFRIKENAGNGLGTEIFNTAYIYFDQNEAIVTNTTYNINATTLGFDEYEAFKVNIYPNPSREFINVSSKLTIDELSIYGVDGRLYKKISNQNMTNLKIDIRNLSIGMYIVKMRSGESIKTLKLIKE
ncbi:MAG: T9SS type A sorting domain-containing protein [Brumimicrobium sp.]